MVIWTGGGTNLSITEKTCDFMKALVVKNNPTVSLICFPGGNCTITGTQLVVCSSTPRVIMQNVILQDIRAMLSVSGGDLLLVTTGGMLNGTGLAT